MMNFKKFLIENKLKFKSGVDAYIYASRQKQRIPEVEEYLLQSKDIYYGYSYVIFIIGAPWPEYEKILLESEDQGYCFLYASHVLKRRWYEAEEIICTKYALVKDYCIYFGLSIKDFQNQLIQRSPFIIHKISRLDPDLAKKYHGLLVNKDVGIL